jgi:hypothetical protein
MASEREHQKGRGDPGDDEVLRTIQTRLKDVLGEFAKLKQAAASTPSMSAVKLTAFEQIKQYLESTGNMAASTTVIRKQTGLSRGALSNVIYGTHADQFVSAPSPSNPKKKLWKLKPAVARPQDMRGLKAHQCARKILMENGNKPMHALTIAREALRRGYAGRATSTGDELLWLTAKSFWARLARTNRDDFEQTPRHMYFRVRGVDDPARKHDLFSDDLPDDFDLDDFIGKGGEE